MHLHKNVDEQLLRDTLKSFVGKITQLPPVRSNVKRQYREREIYYADIIDIEDRDVLFKAGVESGTYIRKLVHDMGEKLGVGAHMSDLRRTKVSSLTEDSGLVTLQDLEDGMYFYRNENDPRLLSRSIQSIEVALDFLPKIFVSDTAVDTVCHGSPLAVPGVVKVNKFEKGQLIGMFTLKGELIALGSAELASDDILKGAKGIAIKTDSVIMSIGTYPRYIKKT